MGKYVKDETTKANRQVLLRGKKNDTEINAKVRDLS